MVVLNTRPDALALLGALEPDDALFHISTFLCPAHRRDVLEDVKRRLPAGEPCRLITTQVVEAGVDLDFPTVFRAMGPLDRIVQAAGRCNRKGTLPSGGRVVVFEPAEGGLPERSGPYADGTRIARRVLAVAGADSLFDPGLYQSYFRELFSSQTIDAAGVQALRRRLDYPEVARRAKLIEEDEESVVVPYPNGNERVEDLMKLVRGGWGNPRELLRALQPFIVGVRRNDLRRLEVGGLIQPLRPGLWEWSGHYDRLRGIAGAQPGFFVV
jgi:CRISPR-associated endonuclease/helicase Cas3